MILHRASALFKELKGSFRISDGLNELEDTVTGHFGVAWLVELGSS